jgi:hypothetical protein
MRPLFSVLMPTHRRPDVIGHAIGSVLRQEWGDFELLVVGDGATAETAAVVGAFDDARVRWLDFPKAPHFGYANRNAALDHARGRYIAFAADDDLLLPGHLAELKRLLDEGYALACVRALWVSSDGIAAPFSGNLDLRDERDAFLTRANSVPASCFAYRVEAIPEKRVWPEEVREAGDWRLWHRIIGLNPDRSLGCSGAFTVVHFSAPRKNARDSRMPELRRLLEFADRSDWWPPGLRLRAGPGSTVQAEWARRLETEGGSFVAEVDRSIRLVLDRLAWEYVQSAVQPTARKASVLAPAAVLPDDFDPREYLRLHADVAAAGLDPARHWLEFGYFEGRDYKAEQRPPGARDG